MNRKNVTLRNRSGRTPSRGSVILFGSCLHKSNFVLDTVFVVADHIDHTKRDYRDHLRDRYCFHKPIKK
jgi:hypothetical protein